MKKQTKNMNIRKNSDTQNNTKQKHKISGKFKLYLHTVFCNSQNPAFVFGSPIIFDDISTSNYFHNSPEQSQKIIVNSSMSLIL